MKETFQYCLKNNLLGVGWQVNSIQASRNWDEYLREAEGLYGKVQVCKYINSWVKKGDLVWTRDALGQYYLAKVNSGWEYWIAPEATEKDIDIANIFRVTFVRVKLDAVPGKVVACFRSRRSIQEIASGPAIEYSKYLWNSLSGSNDYPVDRLVGSDIFEMLDDEETEDLLFMYLQSNGWFVVPNSRKKDTMSYEFLAIDPATGERAISQVKTGHVPLCRDDYSSYKEKVFLFQSNNVYSGAEHPNVMCLDRAELLDFMQASRGWLPDALRMKLDLCESIAIESR